VGEGALPRRSQDTRVCPRAGWLLALLATHELHVLNGMQPGDEAAFTCITATGSSVVDLLASRDPSLRLTAHPTTLEGLSDHAVQLVVYPGLIKGPGGSAFQGAQEQRRFY